jgi:hypothetical protein
MLPNAKVLIILAPPHLILSFGHLTMVDMALTTSASLDSKSAIFVANKTLSVLMEKTLRELREESLAHAMRWTMSVTMVIVDPLVQQVLAL